MKEIITLIPSRREHPKKKHSNDLLIDNTFWEQNREDKYTFVTIERNNKSLIDFIVHTQELKQEG